MKNIFTRFSQNWKSGLTVSLVSIPLSVSLAVASHASPVMGIVTAVYAGLVAAFFGGSNYNVVGPTGALSGILATFAIAHGTETLPTLAVVSGCLILIAYLLKLERYLVFVPGGAIHGFTLGVAFIIGLNQLNFALGLTGLTSHEKFIQNVFESIVHIGAMSPISVTIFSLGLVALFFFKKFLPKLPGAIFVAPVGIIAGLLSANHLLPFSIQTLGALYPNMSFALFLPHPVSLSSALIAPSFAIALVAILETMVSAKIADGMTKTKHNKRNEMRGLGLANIVSGLMGGMPATAALARTSLNIKTGANDKSSAVISSVCVALISLFLLTYFKFIPLSIIAAILVYVAIQMVETEHFKRMFMYDKKNLFVSLLVAGITIVEDPIIGILSGITIASLFLMEKLSRGQFDLVMNSNKKMIGRLSGEKLTEVLKDSDTILYSFKGMLCYINSESHLERLLASIHSAKYVILRFRSVYYMDMDGVEAVDEIINSILAQKKSVYLTSLNPVVEEMLRNSSTYKHLQKEGKVYAKSIDVLHHLGFKL